MNADNFMIVIALILASKHYGKLEMALSQKRDLKTDLSRKTAVNNCLAKIM